MKKDRNPEVHYYEWSVIRWVTSQAHDELDVVGRSIYREMLDTCYAQGAVPADPEILCRKCACSPEQLAFWLPKVRRHFYQDKHDSGLLRNKFADLYRAKFFRFVRKQKKNAKNRPKSVPEKSSGSNEIRSGGNSLPPSKPQPIQDNTIQDNTIPPTPFDEVAERMYARHPKKKNRALVAPALWAAIQKSPDPGAKLAEIDRAHETACRSEDWTKNGGRFAPKLDEWIADEGYTAVHIPQAQRAEYEGPSLPPVIHLTPEELEEERVRLDRMFNGTSN